MNGKISFNTIENGFASDSQSTSVAECFEQNSNTDLKKKKKRRKSSINDGQDADTSIISINSDSEEREKIKKKKSKTDSNSVSSIQLTELELESQSLLNFNKPKTKKHKDPNQTASEKLQKQGDSFLNGLETSFLTDDDEIAHSDKRKKRKIKQENFFTSSPETTLPKKSKKNQQKIIENSDDKQIKQENNSCSDRTKEKTKNKNINKVKVELEKYTEGQKNNVLNGNLEDLSQCSGDQEKFKRSLSSQDLYKKKEKRHKSAINDGQDTDSISSINSYTEEREKIKKKKGKTYNNSVSSIQLTELELESQSLLNFNKPKTKNHKDPNQSASEKRQKQSDSFLNGLETSFLTDNDEIAHPDKRKKRKIKQENFFTSSPETTLPKKSKKNQQKIIENSDDKQIKQEKDSCGDTSKEKTKNKNINKVKVELEKYTEGQKNDVLNGNLEDLSQCSSDQEKFKRSLPSQDLYKKKEKRHKSAINDGQDTDSISSINSYTEEREKIKKKKSKTDNNSVSSIQLTELELESQSLLNFNKPKTKKHKDPNQSASEKRQKQSDSFLNGLETSFLTDNDEIAHPDKRKKRKIKQENFFTSSPETTLPKKSKKNQQKIIENSDDKQIKQENDSCSDRTKEKTKNKNINKVKVELEKYTEGQKNDVLNGNLEDLSQCSGDQEKFKRSLSSQALYKKNYKSNNTGDLNNSSQEGQRFNGTSQSDKEGEKLDLSLDDDEQFKLAVCELSRDVEFHVPELHKILNRASKPTPRQRALLEAKNIEVKRGKFTAKEDKQIVKNWQEIVKMAGIDDKPEWFYCLVKRRVPMLAKRNFLYYLSRNLDERTPFSIFNRFKLLTRKTKKGRFSEEEDDYIKSLIANKTNQHYPVKDIALKLRRSTLSIEHRIVKLQKVHTRKIKWRKNNAATFIKYLLKVTKNSDVRALKDRVITREEWNKLSRKLDDVPVRILVRAWQEKLHPALFMPQETYDLRRVKLQLIQMFKENRENDWKTVNWRDYASQFEGLTVLRVYSLLKQLTHTFVPSEKRKNLKKCINILSKLSEENLRRHVIHKMVYKDGVIQGVKN